MDKYNSVYNGDKLNSTIKLIENNWIQLQVINGAPNSTLRLIPGSKFILTNEISNTSSWTTTNSTYYVYTEDSTFQYPNYDVLVVNCSSASNSKLTCTVSSVSSHIYYFQAFVDGLNSNGVNHGIQIESSSDANTVYASSFTTNLDAIMMSCRGTVDTSSIKVALYANKSSTIATSEVHFGRFALVDLTYCFGVGKEPTKEWCDSHINFYSPDGYYNSSIIITDNKNGFSDIITTLDNTGSCLVNLPGFDTWSSEVIFSYYQWKKYSLATYVEQMSSSSYDTSTAYQYLDYTDHTISSITINSTYDNPYKRIYVGSSYSFDGDDTQGNYSVNQSTTINVSEQGAQNAIGKYVIKNYMDLSGTRSGGTMYKIIDASYSLDNITNLGILTLQCETYTARKGLFYVGSSYTFDAATGIYTLKQDTFVSPDNYNVQNKYYINSYRQSEGTFSGSTMLKPSSIGFYNSFNAWYSVFPRTAVLASGPQKGNYIEDVYSFDRNAYPDDGDEGDYWYEFIGENQDTEYSSVVVDTVKRYYLDASVTS